MSHAVDPEHDGAVAARGEAYELGAAVIVMDDNSALVFDGVTADVSAWPDWARAKRALQARAREADAEPEFCLAEAMRHEIEQGHLDPAFLYNAWLSEGRMDELAVRIDPSMDAVGRAEFVNVWVYPMPDGSILIYDGNIEEWRSASNAEDCTLMLRLRYAPKTVGKDFRKVLRY